MPTKSKSVWETLSVIDCNDHTEEKGQFTYLSWAWAWRTLKMHYPLARFDKQGHQVLDDGSCMVSVRVWIPADEEGINGCIEDVIELLPVLDFKNNPIMNPNCFDINSAYQRCLVKCLAYMGLGMYIYQGETINPDAPVSYSVQDTEGNKEQVTDLTSVADIILTFIQGNDKTLDSLRQYWAINKQPIEHLENLNPDNYKRVYEAFTAKANELKETK